MTWMRSAAALVVLLAATGCTSSLPSPTESPPDATQPAESSPPIAEPTPPADAALDVSTWTAYTSAQHEVSLAHPPDWSVVPAERPWVLANDAGVVDSVGQDGFLSPDGIIWVTVWTAVYSGEESVEGLLGWVEQYCAEGSPTDCDSIDVRAEPLCLEQRDCHPALLVPFESDVQAFFTGGIHGPRIVGVASWRASDFPVGGMGTSREILDAFLSTMDVWPGPRL